MMNRYCKFTGADKTSANSCTNPIKPMCVNCKSFSESEKDCACMNAKILEKKKNDFLKNIPEDVEIESIVLKRIVLKDPTKKCGNHEYDTEGIYKELDRILLGEEVKPSAATASEMLSSVSTNDAETSNLHAQNGAVPKTVATDVPEVK